MAILVLVALAICGCSGSLTGEPTYNQGALSPFTLSKSKDALKAVPAACGNQLSSTSETTFDPTARDGCIFAEMSIIDQAYFNYRTELFGLVNGGNAASDILGIGISTAGTLVAGAATKTILSAINAGVSGAKAKVDSDVLYSKSISLILTQMDADRADWKSRILAQIKNADTLATSGKYTMYQASTDLLSYYEAGTWADALISLDTQAGTNLNNCQSAVKTIQAGGTMSAADQCGPQTPQDGNTQGAPPHGANPA